MNELRKQFEALPEIEQSLRNQKYDFDDGGYIVHHDLETSMFVNGAWYAFQEQQKKIDEALKLIDIFIPNDNQSKTRYQFSKIKELLK